MGEISVKTGNNARNGGKNSLNRLIRCVCGKKIGPDPRNFNQRVSLGRNDLLIRTFPNYLLQVEPIALACFCFEMKGVRRFLSLVLLFSIVSYYLYYNTIQNAQSITGYGVSDFFDIL
ncbi:TPA: hypothetical protein P7Z35_005361 [Klebsiella pneumoniae]|nr:hypothetical protein [Klebsiella pneumoniae]HDQ2700342.1 hypothetical protein [Klebsiella pneumoniae]